MDRGERQTNKVPGDSVVEETVGRQRSNRIQRHIPKKIPSNQSVLDGGQNDIGVTSRNIIVISWRI